MMVPMYCETFWSNYLCVSFRLLYNKILTSMTVIIERISWLINVTDRSYTQLREFFAE
jgi:hypothetical protein